MRQIFNVLKKAYQFIMNHSCCICNQYNSNKAIIFIKLVLHKKKNKSNKIIKFANNGLFILSYIYKPFSIINLTISAALVVVAVAVVAFVVVVDLQNVQLSIV